MSECAKELAPAQKKVQKKSRGVLSVALTFDKPRLRSSTIARLYPPSANEKMVEDTHHTIRGLDQNYL